MRCSSVRRRNHCGHHAGDRLAQHSARGFLAGVVRKRLGLRLESEKGGDERIYRVVAKSKAPKSESRSVARRRDRHPRMPS